MAKDIKLTLHKNHREAIEKLKERTGLSFNQIINLVWVKSAGIRLDIQANHSADK